MSWRESGGFWSVVEDGAGDLLRIHNSCRCVEIDKLDDEDLMVLHHLIGAAIAFRKWAGPAAPNGDAR
jgi:hypothetical protein